MAVSLPVLLAIFGNLASATFSRRPKLGIYVQAVRQSGALPGANSSLMLKLIPRGKR
jgi:hypothetical protein